MSQEKHECQEIFHILEKLSDNLNIELDCQSVRRLRQPKLYLRIVRRLFPELKRNFGDVSDEELIQELVDFVGKNSDRNLRNIRGELIVDGDINTTLKFFRVLDKVASGLSRKGDDEKPRFKKEEPKRSNKSISPSKTKYYSRTVLDFPQEEAELSIMKTIRHQKEISRQKGSPIKVKLPDRTAISVLKQDGRTLEGTTLTMTLPYLVEDGPRDRNCHIASPAVNIKRDKNNNFVHDANTDEFHYCHAFGICSSTLNMVDRDLLYLVDVHKVRSPRFEDALELWKKRKSLPIFLHHHKQVRSASYTNTNDGELHFYHFKDNMTFKKVYTWLSFDIIAHETGHAALDKLRPDLSQDHIETLALEESWGDLIALFMILDQQDLRSDLIKATKGDLQVKCFLTEFAEEYGLASGKKSSLRTYHHKKTYYDVLEEEHSLSEVFTGAFYSLMVAALESLRVKKTYLAEDELLIKVGRDFRCLLLRAFIEVPTSSPSFAQVARKMVKIVEEVPDLQYIEERLIFNAFKEREIDIYSKCDTNKKKRA